MSFDAGTLKGYLTLDNTAYKNSLNQSQKQTKDFGSVVEKNSAKIKGMGVAMTVAGGAILAGLTKASQGARDFNKQIANITTLTTPAITNVNTLKEKIRDLSVDASKDTSDVAGGAYQVASAFGEAALQGRSLEINVKGAAAGMATTTEAINLTSAVTKGFGDVTDEAQQKVMDLSFVTVKLGQTTFPELAASIGKTVPLMAAMGGKQEELFAGFATLTGVTGSAAEVSTQFAGILGALIKPTGEMKEAIKQAGKEHLGLSDATGKTLVSEMGLVEAIKAIIATTDGSMTSLGKLIRRKEALTAVLALTGGQADVFNEKLEAMYKSENAAGEAFQKISSGVNAAGFAMEQAQVKMQIASQRLGEAVTPILAEIKTTIASVVEAIADWMRENPLLAKSIIGVTTVLAGLMVVVGPMLIVLPKLVKAYTALKAILTATVPVIVANKNAISGLIPSHSVTQANKLGLAIKKIGPIIGKVAAAGAAFYVGWQVGKAIDDWLGLSKAIQKALDALMPKQEFYDKISMMKIGFTENGERALHLRDSLIELAQQTDKSVTGLRDAVRVIKENKEAYDNLHPAQKRVVDGMGQVRDSIQAVIEKSSEIPTQTQAQRDVLESILSDSATRIQEVTLSETDFKIEQLNREYQKNLELFQQNQATKEQLLMLERAHSLSIQNIRDEAYRIQQEKIKKQDEEKKKKEEELKKKKEEELKKEEERQQKHYDFLENLKKEQQELVLKQIEERDGWRVAELQRIQNWEIEQYIALDNRLAASIVTWKEYQDELNAIKETGEKKRFDIEESYRKETEKLENEKMNRIFAKVAATISKMNEKYQWFVGTLGDYFSALAQNRENELNNWYDAELKRINESSMSNEERTAAIEALDAKMHQKKAELEAASAKRERFLAIANAIGNTAVAVTKAMTIAPWPFNLPAIAFAIATGAAQIAAIGGAYSGPDVGDFSAPGGTGGSGGGGGGAGATGETGGTRPVGMEDTGGKAPGFQTGTNGYITPPSDFYVGEPYSTERVKMRGDLKKVKMSVEPTPGKNIKKRNISRIKDDNVTKGIKAIAISLGKKLNSYERIKLNDEDVKEKKQLTRLFDGKPSVSDNSIQLSFDFSNMQVRDGREFENHMREFLPQFMQQLFDSYAVKVPRGAING